MKQLVQANSEIQVYREAWRLRELGCKGSLQLQGVMLYAVARAIGRPIEAMPRPEPCQLWTAFAAAMDCTAIQAKDLPLALLSSGERFAIAVGLIFQSAELPTGETFLEVLDSASGTGTGPAGSLALNTVLTMPTVQRLVPADVLRFHATNGI